MRASSVVISGLISALFFVAPLRAQTESTDVSKIQVPPGQAALVGKGAELEEQQQTKKGKSQKSGKATVNESTSAAIDRNPGKLDERRAADKLLLEIRDCLRLRKTLVVWLVEQSRDSAKLAANMANQIDSIAMALKGTPPGKLEMAVIGYGENVNVLTPEPVGDLSQLNSAIAALRDNPSDDGTKPVRLFQAVSEAVKKFLPYRQRGYEVLFIVVGASPGSDQDAAAAPIAALRQSAVSVFAVGPAMPFVQFMPRGNNRKGAPPDAINDKRLSESLEPERIQLSLSGNQSAVDLNDSGFGPFGLERLTRETGGQMLRLRRAAPQGWVVDPITNDIRFDLQAKYAPDYVSGEQYAALLAENKCRQALHEAALLPPAQGLDSPKTEFPKEKDEAALARNVTGAQKLAATLDQPLQRLYDTLAAAESSRSSLIGARWQAAYDLAMGQTLAAKARLDGYNAMLALIKQGKSFTNADSTRWVLEPADEIAAASAMDKMAKNSRVYLQRVIKEHPGTPWAAIAERELRYPAGWRFVEK